MAMIAATAPSHRTATAMTFAKTTHKIANMVAMLTHRTCRLKMPRPAAYLTSVELGVAVTFAFNVTLRITPEANLSTVPTEQLDSCRTLASYA
jgi:hypothetical protein